MRTFCSMGRRIGIGCPCQTPVGRQPHPRTSNGCIGPINLVCGAGCLLG
jgi:hypothetical protein